MSADRLSVLNGQPFNVITGHTAGNVNMTVDGI